jgi:acetaldehyde dehydrogenase/alcohol dehydrogenase
VDNLKREINIPLTIKEVLNGQDQDFYEAVESLAEQAFDDQCTGANPRYPLIKDLKELYLLAYHGIPAVTETAKV